MKNCADIYSDGYFMIFSWYLCLDVGFFVSQSSSAIAFINSWGLGALSWLVWSVFLLLWCFLVLVVLLNGAWKLKLYVIFLLSDT